MLCMCGQAPETDTCYRRSMELLAILIAAFVVALAVSSIRARRNIRSCCTSDAASDLRMRDAS